MAKYKQTEAENGQGIFLSVNLKEQLIPGTLEYMIDKLIGNKIDIRIFDKKYKNDKTGAKAIPPKVLVKLIIYGYSKGVQSSRALDELCKNNIIAKALTEDMEPHWTTIAGFISGNEEYFLETFVKVLTYCSELELIGGNMFAIDGCRLPSNASISLTGTAEDLEKRVKIYRRMAEKHIAKHKRKDSSGDVDEKTKQNYEKQQKKLNRHIEKLDDFLDNMERKEGKRGKEIKSNVTDNESALIYSSSGYIQGYIGMAVTDEKSQIILNAEAVGSANECEHLPKAMSKTIENLKKAKVKVPKKAKRLLLADKNYFSEDNLRVCKGLGVEAIIPDSQYKSRLGENKEKRYQAEDFKYREKENLYECPNGKKLLYKGKSTLPGSKDGMVYQASLKDCRLCPLVKKCIRSKKKTKELNRGRMIIISKSNNEGSLCRELREKLDTIEYQDLYAQRIQIIEPVFANITSSKRLNRFTLRGKNKVNSQWQLYCIMHNLGKCLNEFNKKEKFL